MMWLSFGIRILLMLLPLVPAAAYPGVDTLKGTGDISESVAYSWENCNGEITGEDCRRFNGGGLQQFQVGNSGVGHEMRTFFILPGWDGTVPDSSKLLVYCVHEEDAADRNIFLYPLTTEIFEGSEVSYNLGDYPDPDSGVTWNHAWLDVGDGDSSTFSSAGGDYTSGVACTTTVTDTGQYFAFQNFNRILTYWDTSGCDYGLVLINQSSFPSNSSNKSFRASEGSASQYPLVILYTGDEPTSFRRRRLMLGARN